MSDDAPDLRNAKMKKRRTALWRAGGTGRRRRLKIVRPQGHGGSSPSPATIIIKALAPKPKSLRVATIPLRRRGWHHPAQGRSPFELAGYPSARTTALPGAGKKRDTCSRPGGPGLYFVMSPSCRAVRPFVHLLILAPARSAPVILAPARSAAARSTPVRSTPVRFAPWRMAPVSLAHEKRHPVKLTPESLIHERSAAAKLTFVSLAPEKLAPLRSAVAKLIFVSLAPEKLDSLRLAVAKLILVRSAPAKLTLSRLIRLRSAPVRFMPARSKLNSGLPFLAVLWAVLKALTSRAVRRSRRKCGV